MRKLLYPGQISLSVLAQSLPAGIYFRVDNYFDPFGDGKSGKKLLNRKFYYSFKSYKEILDRFNDNKYYGSEVIFSETPYKNAINW